MTDATTTIDSPFTYTDTRNGAGPVAAMAHKPVALPETVQIGPFVYSIIEVDVIADGSWACIIWESRQIQLKRGLALTMKPVALLHEVLHGINELTGKAQSKHDEEVYVHSQAPLLTDTFRRNPALVAFLMDGAT